MYFVKFKGIFVFAKFYFMNKIILTTLFLLYAFSSFSQEKQEQVLYIVDSVVVVDDPDENDSITDNDIEKIEVVTSLERIKAMGYEGKMDKLIFLTTKAYLTRSDEVRRIPTTKSMKKINGVWYFKDMNVPYSGRIIDYFMNGHLEGEGTLKDGVIEGTRTVYYPNGNKRYFYTYTKGKEDGPSEEYFINGKLKQKGSFLNEKQVGLWQNFYSTGKLKRQHNFDDGNVQNSKEDKKFYDLQNKGIQLMKDGDFKSAIKRFNEALPLNSDYADLYFNRGTAKLNSFDFENAIADYDQAIAIEPLYMQAISNRAFARLRKHEFKDSRVLSKSNGVTVMAAKDNVPIPQEDLDKICADLKLGYELGDRTPMVLDVMKRYCK